MILGPEIRRPRVLSLGLDESLLRSRQLLLESAGFDVISHTDVEGTVPDFDYDVQVCVLGQTIPLRRRLTLAAKIRERLPAVGIVFVYFGNETFDASNLDSLVRTPADPDKLITAVERAIRKAIQRGGGSTSV
jgi:FixJ family two-component response regulator